MNKFTDRDEITKFDHGIVKVAAAVVMEFMCFSENWEYNCVSIKNAAHEKMLSKKYLHMNLYDSDEDEVRQVVGIEWKARARCVPAQLVLEDMLEPYYINNTIYQMVMEAPKPYNDGYKLLQKIE